MGRVIPFDNSSQDGLPGLSGLPPVSFADAAMAAPDAGWAVFGSDGSAAACCSLWWTGVSQLPGKRLGIIGHYAAREPISARLLLDHACRELAARGCTLAVGPMDGNTWRRYRFVTDRGDEPMFFLEPDNPDAYPEHWRGAGFAPLATYRSAVNEQLDVADPFIQWVEQRFCESGLRFRPLDPTRFDDELRRIHQLSLLTFANNLLYSPMGADEFLNRYRPLVPLLRPPLVVLAEEPGKDEGGGDRLVGYLFALPDHNEPKRGCPARSIVAKTTARLPSDAYSGLGAVMLSRCYRAALGLGYTRAYSALMHDDNPSRKLFAKHLRPIRRYTLFGRGLCAAGASPADVE